MSDETLLRIPPHSDQAEQSVIGAVMMDPAALEQVADIVRAEDFYRADHQRIWKAITALSHANKPHDYVTLAEHLDGVGELDRIGGIGYLGSLANNCPSSANVKHYAGIVRERATKRRLIQAGNEIAEMGFAPGGAREAVDRAQTAVMVLAESSPTKGPRLARELMPSVIDVLEYRNQKQGDLTGLSTGFVDLDRKTHGLHPGQLIIVAGRPSMGKTTFAVNIAEHVVEAGKAVVIFSMEMGAEEILDRSLASLGRVPHDNLRSGTLDESDWAKVTKATGLIAEAPLYLDDSGGLTINEIRARARRVKRIRPDLGLVVVDYLQLMSGEGDRREEVIAECSRGLKSLAKELQLPVIALSQLNRQVEARPNKRPRMSDLRESGAIEQDADLIVFLYRDEVYDSETKFKGMAEAIIGKQRNGEIGMVPLKFNGHWCRFDSWEGRIPEPEQPAKGKWRGRSFDDD